MKNVILMLAVVAGISACSSTRNEPQVAPVQTVAPAQTYVTNQAYPAPQRTSRCAQKPQAQGGCGSHSYTVSEPVEVVYKNVTYTTVYEPKTYSSTSFVKKPYTCSNGNLCPQAQRPTGNGQPVYMNR